MATFLNHVRNNSNEACSHSRIICMLTLSPVPSRAADEERIDESDRSADHGSVATVPAEWGHRASDTATDELQELPAVEHHLKATEPGQRHSSWYWNGFRSAQASESWASERALGYFFLKNANFGDGTEGTVEAYPIDAYLSYRFEYVDPPDTGALRQSGCGHDLDPSVGKSRPATF